MVLNDLPFGSERNPVSDVMYLRSSIQRQPRGRIGNVQTYAQMLVGCRMGSSAFINSDVGLFPIY